MEIALLVKLCGVAHIALVFGSLAVPMLLDWKSALGKTPSLIRQMFWTYAGYILSINLFFGIVSLFLTGELLSGSGLAVAVTLLIALYWLVRLVIQFVYFDKSDIPQQWIYTVGEWVLVGLFVLFSVVYGYAFYWNWMV